jgi:hypothetical protein
MTLAVVGAGTEAVAGRVYADVESCDQSPAMQAKLDRLELEMSALPQAECEVAHIFTPGLYTRQVSIKAGTFAVGHYQKSTHLNVMLSGRVTMIEPDGSNIERCAPFVYVAGPGRKVGYVHEDMVWLNVYPTSETDVSVLEALLLDKIYNPERIQGQLTADDDFAEMLKELGVTADTVRQQSEESSDLTPFPHGSYGVRTGASLIEGTGLLATSTHQPGDLICMARIGGKRTPAGRYTNHSRVPNARMAATPNGDIALVAVRRIKGSRGGQDGDEVTVDYRQALAVNALAVQS